VVLSSKIEVEGPLRLKPWGAANEDLIRGRKNSKKPGLKEKKIGHKGEPTHWPNCSPRTGTSKEVGSSGGKKVQEGSKA